LSNLDFDHGILSITELPAYDVSLPMFITAIARLSAPPFGDRIEQRYGLAMVPKLCAFAQAAERSLGLAALAQILK
jgi:hypothetical protein